MLKSGCSNRRKYGIDVHRLYHSGWVLKRLWRRIRGRAVFGWPPLLVRRETDAAFHRKLFRAEGAARAAGETHESQCHLDKQPPVPFIGGRRCHTQTLTRVTVVLFGCRHCYATCRSRTPVAISSRSRCSHQTHQPAEGSRSLRYACSYYRCTALPLPDGRRTQQRKARGS